MGVLQTLNSLQSIHLTLLPQSTLPTKGETWCPVCCTICCATQCPAIHQRMCGMSMNENKQPADKGTPTPIYLKPEATPFEVVTMDLITKLPVLQGCDSILMVTDHNCTKAVVLIPCKETATTKEIAYLYIRHVFSWFGLPVQFISNWDPCFTSKFMKELCQILEVEQNISTAYHPWTDGQSKWTNQWVEQYLRFIVYDNYDNWTYYLPLAEFVHNNWLNESMWQTPFFLLMGYNPQVNWIDKPSLVSQVALHLDQFKMSQEQHHQAIQRDNGYGSNIMTH